MRILIALAFAATLSACTTTPAPSASTASGDTQRFSGTVRAIDNGCFADGVCSVTVDDTTVVTMVGWSRDTWGHRDDGLAVGTRVDVACRKTAEGCTLAGSAGYYIRTAR